MNSSRIVRNLGQFVLVGMICMSLTVGMMAQVKTETSVSHGQPSKTVQVDRGEVVYVSGHDLIVKKPDGKIVHLANVPDSARAIVDGKELGIKDLKPGMKLERTITTTTTPRTITTVETVTGKVWHVNPPSSVILTLADGTNHNFQLPSGQKVTVNGELKDAWGLKKGMTVTATRIVETPETVISHDTKVTGTAPVQAVLAPPADRPIFFALITPAAAPADAPVTTAAVIADELPSTGSYLPLLGLLGVLAIWSSLALKTIRSDQKEQAS